MRAKNAKILDMTDPFPELSVKLTSGDTINLPGDFGDGYSVILFYRGHW